MRTEEFVDAAGLKGKLITQQGGAQFIWQHLAGKDALAHVAGEILAICVASHHSGLIDCLTSSLGQPTEDGFAKRMSKSADKTHLQEALGKADPVLLDEARHLLKQPEITQAFLAWDSKILGAVAGNTAEEKRSSPVYKQQIGLLVRALFSCLIDADRIDTADFEHPVRARRRLRGNYTPWQTLIARLESHLANFTPVQPIDDLRQQISRHCLEAATRDTGIYTSPYRPAAARRWRACASCFTMRTNTISTVSFTLYRSRPSSTRTPRVVRKILEPEGIEAGSVVLEHHSNLTPEDQTWRSKILSENWDAPVVYTTMVNCWKHYSRRHARRTADAPARQCRAGLR